jgi:hypothetical protein
MTKFAILGAGVLGAALLATTLAGPARNFIRPRTARTTDPATRSIPTVSSGMIGRAVLPGCIIATTVISVTVTTGKEGGIDPEPSPRTG